MMSREGHSGSRSSRFPPIEKNVTRITPSLLGNGYSVDYSRDVTSSLGLYQKTSAAYSKQQLKWRLGKEEGGRAYVGGESGEKFGRIASFTSQYAPGMEFRDTSMGSLLKQKERLEREQEKAGEKLIRLTELREKVEAQRELAQRERKRKQEKRELRSLAATAMQSIIRGFICRRHLKRSKNILEIHEGDIDRKRNEGTAFFVTASDAHVEEEETPETDETSAELVAMKTPGMIDLQRNAPVAVLR
mgnify:CR=1 FL=1